MHELGIAEGVIGQVTEKLPGARITRVCLEIGALSGVAADSLRFSFGLAAEGTALEGARLEITEPAARCRCRSCGDEFSSDGPVALCPCGSADVTVLSGADLRITSVSCSDGTVIRANEPSG
jgi:hydrogenase nickel incorporation protein HypA/HybF